MPGKDGSQDVVLAVERSYEVDEGSPTRIPDATEEDDPALEEMRQQIMKTKEQYQVLLDTGKIKDERRIQSIKSMIKGLNKQLRELTTEWDFEAEIVKEISVFPPVGVSDFDREVWTVHNEVRKNPKCIVPELEEMLTRFNGLTLKSYGDEATLLKTEEGANAVRDAINFLKT